MFIFYSVQPLPKYESEDVEVEHAVDEVVTHLGADQGGEVGVETRVEPDPDGELEQTGHVVRHAEGRRHREDDHGPRHRRPLQHLEMDGVINQDRNRLGMKGRRTNHLWSPGCL